MFEDGTVKRTPQQAVVVRYSKFSRQNAQEFIDTEAGIGSYDSIPLWYVNWILRIFIFVPGTFPHLPAFPIQFRSPATPK